MAFIYAVLFHLKISLNSSDVLVKEISSAWVLGPHLRMLASVCEQPQTLHVCMSHTLGSHWKLYFGSDLV